MTSAITWTFLDNLKEGVILLNKDNPQRANVLMRWRVGLQAPAILLLVLFMLIWGR